MKKLHAFPTKVGSDRFGHIQEGMTLRDYFASEALTGLLGFYNNEQYLKASMVANRAYILADAMLKERDKI